MEKKLSFEKSYTRADLEKKYTKDELETLELCYGNPWNEYSYLSFEDYVKGAEEEGIIDELLEDC